MHIEPGAYFKSALHFSFMYFGSFMIFVSKIRSWIFRPFICSSKRFFLILGLIFSEKVSTSEHMNGVDQLYCLVNIISLFYCVPMPMYTWLKTEEYRELFDDSLVELLPPGCYPDAV
jgi:hypothetical protein